MAAVAGNANDLFLSSHGSPNLSSAAAAHTAKGSPSITARAAALTDDAYEQNDSLSAARGLGTISAPKTISNLVMADSADWYRFTMAAKGGTSDNISISFLHAQGDLDLALYNSLGQRIRLSDGVTNSERVSLSGLAAGTYYIKVYGYRGVTNPSYAMSINVAAPAVPTDDAYEDNDTQSTARDLGTLTSAQTISNLVMADGQDWYRFTMGGPGTSADFVAVSSTSTQGNLDVEVLDTNGSQLGLSQTTSNSERVSLLGLASGTYFVHVYGVGGAATPNYSLQIDPGTSTTTPPPPSGAFDIQFVFSGLTAAQKTIFEQAAAKWESIIVGDLPNATYFGTTVDDLLIDARGTPIDGAGNILGQAGPDRFRSGSDLPYHGVMEFDSADLASMQANGTLLGVIEHEMGHVLGIGTIWTDKGLLAGAGTSNPRFTGSQAVAAYNSIFGTTATGVPVENTGGSGTRDSHWRESVFSTELMTGWVGPGSNMPISRVTVGSLADLGYSVNMAAADAYTRPGASSSSIVSASTTTSTRGGGSFRENLTSDVLPLNETVRHGHLASWNAGANHVQPEGTLSVATQRSHEAATDALLSNWLSLSEELSGRLRRV